MRWHERNLFGFARVPGEKVDYTLVQNGDNMNVDNIDIIFAATGRSLA